MNGEQAACPPHDLMLLRTEKRVERSDKEAGHSRRMDLVGRDVVICQKCGQWQIIEGGKS